MSSFHLLCCCSFKNDEPAQTRVSKVVKEKHSINAFLFLPRCPLLRRRRVLQHAGWIDPFAVMGRWLLLVILCNVHVHLVAVRSSSGLDVASTSSVNCCIGAAVVVIVRMDQELRVVVLLGTWSCWGRIRDPGENRRGTAGFARIVD